MEVKQKESLRKLSTTNEIQSLFSRKNCFWLKSWNLSWKFFRLCFDIFLGENDAKDPLLNSFLQHPCYHHFAYQPEMGLQSLKKLALISSWNGSNIQLKYGAKSGKIVNDSSWGTLNSKALKKKQLYCSQGGTVNFHAFKTFARLKSKPEYELGIQSEVVVRSFSFLAVIWASGFWVSVCAVTLVKAHILPWGWVRAVILKWIGTRYPPHLTSQSRKAKSSLDV